jgi:hypothetical protein
MGTVVIGGLLVATFITLFITPTFYVAFERLLGKPAASREQPDGARMPQPAE